jgi:hypothetical protein
VSWLRVALLCLCLATGPSCARTVYTNLHPQLPSPAPDPTADRSSPRYWRHFFLFGWIPGEMVIDAAAYCGGTDRIERIETRESFVQGFIAAFAGYYVNIYSPYTGRVVCDRHVKAHR